jgi:hypothetical protein
VTYDNGALFQPLAGTGPSGATGLGRQEISVRAEDADRARALLAKAPR